MKRMIELTLVCLALAMPAMAAPQEKPAADAQEKPAPPSAGPFVPVRLQLVLSRFQGEKKISSMPYTLQLTANDRAMTNLRMGVEVPILNNSGAFHYRSVGTNIDSRAERTADGTFKVYVTVNDSSVRFEEGEKPAAAGTPAASSRPPAFRTFTANFTILLRDGQTVQYTAATDPVSGEVLKVDATLNVLK